MPALRTPEERFEDLPDFGYDPSFVDVEHGRMAYVDVPGEGDETFLCLHGEPTWGFLYRKMIPTLATRGRVVCPDYLGFGRSDKLDSTDAYSYDMLMESLLRFVEKLDLQDAILVAQDWGGILGLRCAAVDLPDRFARIVAMNTAYTDGTQTMPETWQRFHAWVEEMAPDLPIGFMVDAGTVRDLPDDVWAAYDAPFPDASYKTGPVALPDLVPREPDMPGAASQREVKEALKAYGKPFFVCFSEDDPITRSAAPVLRKMVPTADREPETWIQDAGHFIQEDAGEEAAEAIVGFVDRRPLP